MLIDYFITIDPSPYFELNPVTSPYYHAYPTLVQYYNVLYNIVIVEFLLLGLGIFLSVFFKYYLDYKERKNRKNIQRCKKEMLSLVYKGQPLIFSQITAWHNKGWLIPAMTAVDSLIEDTEWSSVKKKIAQELLLRQARRLKRHSSWFAKLDAARSLCFYAAPEDVGQIVELIKEPVFVVRYAAALAAVRLARKEVIDGLFSVLETAPRFHRLLLSAVWRRADATTIAQLEARFSETLSNYEKVSCLEALEGKLYHNIYPALEQNLYRGHDNLRIAIVRFLRNYPLKAAIAQLIKCLGSAEWQVQAAAARSLGQFGLTEAVVHLVPLLRHKQWWVRRNAALALKAIGSTGIEALKMQDAGVDKFAYEIAQFVLSN